MMFFLTVEARDCRKYKENCRGTRLPFRQSYEHNNSNYLITENVVIGGGGGILTVCPTTRNTYTFSAYLISVPRKIPYEPRDLTEPSWTNLVYNFEQRSAGARFG